MGQTSNMIETDYQREKNPRKVKKKAMRRKGETLESLLVANSESQITSSKDRSSRKVPPRTTKLKPRHPQTIRRICREQLQEVISSQQKILSNYSPRYYHAKFRSTDSSEIISSCGELDNFSAPAQSSAKLELTKVVPIDESDTLVTASAPINGSAFLKVDDGQILATQHEHAEMEQICKGALVEQNDIFSTSGMLQGGTVLKDEQSNCPLQSVREVRFQSAVVPVNHDDDHCRLDEVSSDQENFVDVLNTESEGAAGCDMKSKRVTAKIEASKLNYHEEVESALHEQFSELVPATDLSSGLNNPCDGREPTRAESYLLSDSSPSAVSDTKDTYSDSDSCRQLSGGSWINDREPFNDVDLMDVSSSSSVTSDNNVNFETNNNLNGCEQNQDVSFLHSDDYHAAAAPSSDKQLSQTSSSLDGLAIGSSDYHGKAYRSAEHGQNNELDGTFTIFGQPNDISHDGGQIRVPDVDDLLHSGTPNQEQTQLPEKQFEECTSPDTFVQGTASKLGTLPDMDPVLHMNDLELDNVAFPEEINMSTTPTSLDPDCIHKNLDGVAHSSTPNNPLYESDDDEIVEKLHCLPAEDLYKHVPEGQEICALEEGPCSISLDTHEEDHVQASVVPMCLSNVQVIPGVTESESTFLDDTEAHVNETMDPSPRVLNGVTKPSFIDGPSASNTAPLLGTSNSYMEHRESIGTGKSVEHSDVVVGAEVVEESITSMFEDNMIPWEEERTDGAKFTEKAEVLATISRDENSRHDIPLQSSSPFREGVETVEATAETLGSLEESRGHIFEESMLQRAIFPQPVEIETSGETFDGSHDIQYVASPHCPEQSFYQEELPEESSAEVPCQCDLDKDVAVIMNSNMVGKQSSEVDQDLLREVSAQDSFGTNPFVDPGYTVSFTDPSPGMSYQPYCSEEEQDFLSEILIQHDHTEAVESQYQLNDDSLWESATPPDEAPLPTELMTEQDFSHEYHEMNFTAVTECFDDEASSDSKDITTGRVVSVLDFTCSVSALLAELDQKADCSKPQLAEFSSAGDTPGETSMPFSAREVPDGKTPGTDSGLSSHECLHNEKSSEHITPSVPVKIEQERYALHGVVSDSGTGTCLLDYKKIGEIYDSPSGNVDLVKEERETCAKLVPHVFINKKLDELDVHFINSLPLEPAVRSRGLDELDLLPLSKPVLTQESDVRVLDELNSQTVPSSSIDQTVDDPDVPRLMSAQCPLRNYKVGDLDGTPSCNVQVEAENGSYYSPEFDSRIAPYSSVKDKVDGQGAATSINDIEVEQGWEACASPELDTPPSSNDLLVEKGAEVCVLGELDSKIASCSLPDEKIDDLSCPPLSGFTLVQNESEDHVSGDPVSQVAPYSSVNDKIVGSGAATSVSDTDVELGWEACSSPGIESQIALYPLSDYEDGEIDGTPPSNVQVEAEKESPEFDSQVAPYSSVNDIKVEQGWEPCASPELDFQVPPYPLSEDKVGELDGPSPSNDQVEAENGSYCSPEFDSQIAPGSSNSGALAERSRMTSTSVMAEENCWHSPVPLQTKPFQSVCSEDPQNQPPLPPLQWRLGGPRLGLLCTKDRMPDPVMRTTSLPALSQDIDNSLGSLHRMAESVASDSSQDIQERYQSSMVDDNDQRVESAKSSALPTVDDVSRERDRPFSEACGNSKHEGHITSSPTEAEEHLNDSGVSEHVTNQQDPQQHRLCSDISDITEHISHKEPAAPEDDKTVDDHSAAGTAHLHTGSSSAPGHVPENGSYQEPQHGESISGTSDNEEYSSNASYEQNNLKDRCITSGVPSDATKHNGSSSPLEQGNSQECQLQEQDAENHKGSLSEGPSPSAERIVSEDYHDDHNLGREIIHQPNPSWPSNKSNFLGGIGEGSYVQAEQPPVMGWTVGPQMLHPNYGISVEGAQFEPEVTDHRLIRKPISMRNIPRNPLVDAVAAHDRSTMRKVSELAPTTDKPNPDDRNLWLEQIRNKTFDLKPVGSAKPTSMRAPVIASTGNLRVAAIIEKANAIRQAVGSDDEDDDNWSDT